MHEIVWWPLAGRCMKAQTATRPNNWP